MLDQIFSPAECHAAGKLARYVSQGDTSRASLLVSPSGTVGELTCHSFCSALGRAIRRAVHLPP
jgi:hypothetical protein